MNKAVTHAAWEIINGSTEAIRGLAAQATASSSTDAPPQFTVIQNIVTNEGFVFEFAEDQRVQKQAQDAIRFHREAEVNLQYRVDRIKAELTEDLQDQASCHDALATRF